MHTTFEHEFFDRARTKGIRHAPAYVHENDIWWAMGSLALCLLLCLVRVWGHATDGLAAIQL